MNKLEIEVQYFNGCPHSKEFIENLKRALAGAEFEYAYKETLVETPEKAKAISFRGSPTLLIDGMDMEGVEAPENPGLNCRVYRDGIPTDKEISERLKAARGVSR